MLIEMHEACLAQSRAPRVAITKFSLSSQLFFFFPAASEAPPALHRLRTLSSGLQLTRE